jgi:hypothetical protein
MKQAIHKRPLQKVKYDITQTASGYEIYMVIGSERKFIGATLTRETAEQAVSKLVAMDKQSAIRAECTKRKARAAFNKIRPGMIQVAAMSIDPERAWRFREAVMMLNYTLHMLTDAFDEVAETWNNLVNPNVRQRLTQVMRGVDRVLDDILASQIAGDAADYGHVIDAAHAIGERVNIMVNYGYADDNDMGWRMRAIDECLDRVFPDNWITEKRASIAKNLIDTITKNSQRNDDKGRQ